MADVVANVLYAPIDPLNVSEQVLTELANSPLFLFAAVLSYIVLALRILLGIRANHFYLQHCEKKIAKSRKTVPNLSVAELTALGGVSTGAAVAIAVLVYTAFPILLEMVIGLIMTASA